MTLAITEPSEGAVIWAGREDDAVELRAELLGSRRARGEHRQPGASEPKPRDERLPWSWQLASEMLAETA